VTGPRRLVVFRFDRDPLVCRSRVKLLRALNPGVPLHGLYGGDRPLPKAAARAGARLLLLDGVYASSHDGRWNWKNGDLALLDWFRDVGRRLTFDVLHLVEWDLVCLEPLAEAYADVPTESLGLTCLTPTVELEGRWEWLTGPERLADWQALVEHAGRAWGPVDPGARACLGVGPSFPRAFLESYASVEATERCHDELRIPLVAGCLGFEVTDTGFRHGWWDSADDRFFNVGGAFIEGSVIRRELADPGGRRVFHPVRDRLDLSRQGSRSTPERSHPGSCCCSRPPRTRCRWRPWCRRVSARCCRLR
jgi:hypothetical protein